MDATLGALVVTAASLGFIHTIMGPDHYLPFVMMSWARRWSAVRTTVITVLCGLGHIASSVVLGLIGVWLGLVLKRLTIVESFRGAIAAWLLIAFGLVYFVWGLRRAYRNRPHEHRHFHDRDLRHKHEHRHDQEHAHVHNGRSRASIAPWALFVVFVFGPCEVLIPTLMYPAATSGWFGVAIVTAVFGTVTIATMVGAVLLVRAGVNFVRLSTLERFAHAIAGATICLCGLAIQFGL
ncbi:MAG: urease accessory protein UreH domain-containing protein [Planctomycetota bacterium]|jgi:ABC-type nickel/cobalt efflux system permease component RcnA